MKKIVLLLLFINKLNAMVSYQIKYYSDARVISMSFHIKSTILQAMKSYTKMFPERHNLQMMSAGKIVNSASSLDLIGSENFTELFFLPQVFNFSECIPNDNLYNNIIEKVKKLEENYRAINSQETYDIVAADWRLIQDELLEKGLNTTIEKIQKIFDSSTYAFNFEVLDLTSHLDSLSSAELKLLEMIKSSNLLKISDEKELCLLQKVYYRFLIEIYREYQQNLGYFKSEPNTHKVILEVNDYLQRYNDLKKNIPLEFFFEEEIWAYFKDNVDRDIWEDFSMLLAFLKQTDDTIKLLRPIVNTLLNYSRSHLLPKEFKDKVEIMQKQIINYDAGLLFSIEELPTLQNMDNFLNKNEIINQNLKTTFRKAVAKFQIAHYGLTNDRMIEIVDSLLAKYKNDQKTVSYFINQLCKFIHQRTMSGVSFVKKAR